jgi:hypothetical protein
MKFKLTPFFNWLKLNKVSKPWLVVGKGPSFDRINEINLKDYTVVGLNHVMFEIPCNFGHAIDLDVYDTDEQFKCEHLITPWEPHIDFKPGGKNLIDLMMESRLGFNSILYYNSSRTKKKNLRVEGPEVRVRFFGSVAVMNLLAMSGASRIFTVGVDGGSKYSQPFELHNLLANGRKSFDDQFSEFSITKKKYGVDIVPIFEKR